MAQSFFFSHSVSAFNRPIISYSGAVISSSLRPWTGPENTPAAPSSNRRFHCAITVGCTCYVALSSLSVRTPRTASTATFALNSSLCLRRLVVIVSLPRSSDRNLAVHYSLATCPKNGGKFRTLYSLLVTDEVCTCRLLHSIEDFPYFD